MRRAVLYARVSSDDRGKEDRNLRSQLAMCRSHAKDQGYTVVCELAEDDTGASGAERFLPKLEKAQRMAARGEYDVFVVRELDRLARSLAKQMIEEERLQRSGVEIDYVLDQFENTPEGNLQKNVKAVVAEYERLKIAERNRRGRRNIVEDGQVMLHGDRPPFGYAVKETPPEDNPNAKPRRTLQVYEPEAEIVRTIYRLYVQGNGTGKPLSMRKIAEYLTSLGVSSWADKRESVHKKGDAGSWTWSMVQKILKKPTYKGEWVYGRRNCYTGQINPEETWLTLRVPAIVSEELWDAAQVQRKHNATRGNSRNVKYEYLLRYRATCGNDGASICGHTTTVQGRRYQYYRCNAAMGNLVNVTCDLPSFRVDHVDRAVWDQIKAWMRDPEELRRTLTARQADREQELQPLRDRLSVVGDLLKGKYTALEKALDLYLSGQFEKDMLLERKSRLESEITSLERESQILTRSLEDRRLSDAQIETLSALAGKVNSKMELADKDFSARQRIIELVDAHAVLALEEGEKVIHLSCTLGEADLSLSVPNLTPQSTACNPLILTARIVLSDYLAMAA